MEESWIALMFINAVFIATVTSQGEVTSYEDGVQEILIPMCKNFLPYNLTKLPNEYEHETQLEVYRAIEHLWPYMDYECSENFRLLVCGTYLPKYDPESGEIVKPCKKVCSFSKKRCQKTMRQTNTRWPSVFKCNTYLARGNCIRQNRERRGDIQYPYCIANTIPTCAEFNTSGFLPNLFRQPSFAQVATEILYFDRLIASGCSPNLKFLLCGTFMPICLPETGYIYSIPCKELCDQVYADCAETHTALYNGLPWPNKFQCHRFYDSATNPRCTMPGDF